MKKWMFLILITSGILSVSPAQDIELEKWSYNGLSAGLLSTAASETGTGSSFGSGASFLTVLSSGVARFTSTGTPNESYAGTITASNYNGKTSGIYEISYEITFARFVNTMTAGGKGLLGWGLQSTVSGVDNCNVFFQHNAGVFELLVNDENGLTSPTEIATGNLVTSVKIRQVYNLNIKGSPGSLRVYYSIGTNPDIEIFPGQLIVHSDFRLDGFHMDVQTTTNGNDWKTGDFVIIDDLLFTEVIVVPKLTFIQEEVSYDAPGQDNGVIGGTTYEPGDILRITTTNKNETIVTVTDVSTSLSADPTAFTITPFTTTNFTSLDPNEIYTATYQVEILDGATNGPNEFTVINQIGSGASATAFSASF